MHPALEMAVRRPHALRPHRTAPPAREARARFWRMAILYSIFILVLGANVIVGAVYFVRMVQPQPDALRVTSVERAGRIVHALKDGTFCHYLTFDAASAETINQRTGACDTGANPSIRPAASGFSWGRK